jgi:hypothetical protein
MPEFSDHQISYDNEREFMATNIEEPDDNEAVEEKMCEVTDSEFFPTFEELQSFGFTRNKYNELVRIRAQALIDRERFGLFQ